MAVRMSEVLSFVHIWTYVATLGGCQRLFMRGFRFRSVRSLYKCKIFIMQNSTMWTVLTTVDFTNTDKDVTHQLARLYLFLSGPQKGWIVILVCVACEQALCLGKGRKKSGGSSERRGKFAVTPSTEGLFIPPTPTISTLILPLIKSFSWNCSHTQTRHASRRHLRRELRGNFEVF